MPSRRVSAVLFMSLFTLQLSLAGASVACTMGDHGAASGAGQQDRGASGATSMATHMAMAMPAVPGAEGAGLPPDDASCDEPMSADECRTMAPCSSGFVAPPTAVAQQLAHVPALAIVARVLAPLSTFSPPEPPPPRA